MEPRPVLEKYKPVLSAIVISVLAGFILLIGVFSCIFVFVTYTNSLSRIYGVLGGIGCAIISAFMYVISNIVQDIHYQSHLQEYYVEEARYYHTQSMMMLQSVEGMLRQQYFPQQNPYMTASYQQMPQQTQPQQVFQPEPPKQDAQPLEHVRHSETDEARQQSDPQEDTEAEYKAQFMRPPTVQTRKAFSPKKEE